jgi:hypothetical protein
MSPARGVIKSRPSLNPYGGSRVGESGLASATAACACVCACAEEATRQGHSFPTAAQTVQLPHASISQQCPEHERTILPALHPPPH